MNAQLSYNSRDVCPMRSNNCCCVVGFVSIELLKDLVEPTKLTEWMENVVAPDRLLHKLVNRLPGMEDQLRQAYKLIATEHETTFLADRAMYLNDNIDRKFLHLERQELRLRMLFRHHHIRLIFTGHHPPPSISPR